MYVRGELVPCLNLFVKKKKNYEHKSLLSHVLEDTGIWSLLLRLFENSHVNSLLRTSHKCVHMDFSGSSWVPHVPPSSFPAGPVSALWWWWFRNGPLLCSPDPFNLRKWEVSCFSSAWLIFVDESAKSPPANPEKSICCQGKTGTAYCSSYGERGKRNNSKVSFALNLHHRLPVQKDFWQQERLQWRDKLPRISQEIDGIIYSSQGEGAGASPLCPTMMQFADLSWSSISTEMKWK